MSKTCKSKLATRAILYNDTVGGEQVLRDDLWAVSTDELNEIENRINKAYAEGVIAGQRQLSNTIEMVQEAMFKPAE